MRYKSSVLLITAILLFFVIIRVNAQADFVFSKILRRGYSGEEVRQLQEFLKTMSDIYPEGLVTGYFGPLTQRAVQRFQSKNNIVSSGDENTTGYGLVGPRTRKKLNELIASAGPQSGMSQEDSTRSPQISTTSSNPERKINPALCPDNIWDEAEQKDLSLCPEDNPINNPKSITAKISLQASSSSAISSITTPQISPLTTLAPTTTQPYPLAPSSEEIFSMANFDPSLYGSPHPKIKQEPGSCCSSPYWHRIYSARSIDGIIWQKDGILIKDRASVPSAIYRDDGTTILYYVDGEYDTMDCAISKDGKNFSPGNCTIYGFTEEKAWDPEVVKLENGFYRLYFFAPKFGGENRIMSAVSKDGINWLREKDVRYQQAGIVDPAAIKIGNEWKLYMWYYTSSGGKIVVVKSSDGLNFSKETELSLAGGVPEVVRLDSGDYALYICGLSMWVYTSRDGLNWANGKLAIAEEKKIVCDPAPVKTPSGWMMYYKVMDEMLY